MSHSLPQSHLFYKLSWVGFGLIFDAILNPLPITLKTIWGGGLGNKVSYRSHLVKAPVKKKKQEKSYMIKTAFCPEQFPNCVPRCPRMRSVYSLSKQVGFKLPTHSLAKVNSLWSVPSLGVQWKKSWKSSFKAYKKKKGLGNYHSWCYLNEGWDPREAIWGSLVVSVPGVLG